MLIRSFDRFFLSLQITLRTWLSALEDPTLDAAPPGVSPPVSGRGQGVGPQGPGEEAVSAVGAVRPCLPGLRTAYGSQRRAVRISKLVKIINTYPSKKGFEIGRTPSPSCCQSVFSALACGPGVESPQI